MADAGVAEVATTVAAAAVGAATPTTPVSKVALAMAAVVEVVAAVAVAGARPGARNARPTELKERGRTVQRTLVVISMLALLVAVLVGWPRTDRWVSCLAPTSFVHLPRSVHHALR